MVIGYDASRAFNKHKTGTENYSYQLLKSLAKIDTENEYLVYVRPTFKMQRVWPENFKFITINWPRLWTQAGLAMQTFKDKIDLLFIPAHTLPVISRPGLKKIVVVHDLGAEYLPKMHQLKQRVYLNFMTHQQIKSANKIIAVSKATKEDLINKIGINKSKVEVIYEGVDRKLFNHIKGIKLDQALKKYNLKKDNYFLFVGTIQPRKNLGRLIRAFAQFIKLKRDPISLAIVGSKGWLADDIYKLPKKLGIEYKVKFLGRIDDDDLPGLYSGALALTFPSLFEGFGLPLIEAFACRCPVLTSNISSLKEIAGNNAILVDPLSVDQIKKGMIKLTSKKLREEMIKKGLRWAARFSWEDSAIKTLKVFKEVYTH